METRIKLASNTIPNSHLDRLVEWIKSYPRLTKGNLTNEFEDKFSKYLGSKHTLFVNSGSSANLLIAAANLYYGNLRNKDCYSSCFMVYNFESIYSNGL